MANNVYSFVAGLHLLLVAKIARFRIFLLIICKTGEYQNGYEKSVL
jgi:hypothetical protein